MQRRNPASESSTEATPRNVAICSARSRSCREAQPEQRAQRTRVVGAAGGAGQLLDPHGRLVQQLVDHPVHGAGDLGAGAGVQVGQPAGQPQQLGVDHLGGLAAQRGDGGGDGGGVPLGAQQRQLGVDEVAGGGDVIGGPRPGDRPPLRPPPAPPPACRSPCRRARSTTCTAGIAATPGSRSRGSARSTMISGRSGRPITARATTSVPTTGPLAPVQVTSTSAAASSAGRSASAATRPPTPPASTP